jgi:hypothetical protein
MISPEEFVERLCLVGADRGPRRFPRKRRDRLILMKSIVMGLDSDRTYSESEINDRLIQWNLEVAPAIDTDHVTLRRLLVDEGQLERTADGRAYRVGFPPRPLAFDLEVEDIDVRATVAAYVVNAAERRRQAAERRKTRGSQRPTRRQ